MVPFVRLVTAYPRMRRVPCCVWCRQADCLPKHTQLLAHAPSEYGIMLAVAGMTSIVERNWARLAPDQRHTLRSK